MPAYVRYPPKRPPSQLPSLTDHSFRSAWRIHEEKDCLKPRRYLTGKWRFDAPDGSWPVTYVSATKLGAFAEKYSKRRDIGPDEADQHLSQADSGPLRLIALDQPDTLSLLDLDLNISSVTSYKRTQLWGQRLREWYDGSGSELAHGIRYVGRKAGVHLCTCVWLDRCDSLLSFNSSGQLKDLRRDVLLNADQLNLSATLFAPGATGGWPGR